MNAAARRSLLVVGLLLSGVPARATGRSPAEQLFEQGRALMAERRFAEACPKFLESKRLEDGIGVSLWLADCYDNGGRKALAWEAFLAAAQLAGEKGDAREAVARERAAALLAQLSRIQLRVQGALPAAATVECDGTEVPTARWRSGFYVDKGVHQLRATSDGVVFWESEVAAEGRGDDVALDLLAPPPVARVSPPPPLAAEPAPSSRGLRVAGVVSAGLGAVGLGLVVVFGLEAKSDNDASNGGCTTTTCSMPAHALRVDALHDATAADVALAVGATAVVGGVVLYVLGRPRAASIAATGALAPVVVRF